MRLIATSIAIVSFLLTPLLTAVTSGFHAVGTWIRITFDRLVGKLTARKADAMAGFRPWLPLVIAEAYVQRIVKRETPRMEAGWRLCPSV
jgi:hypothetical protein